MSKSHFVQSEALTKPNQLRELLAQLEALLGQLGHGLGEEALTIPMLFDQVTMILVDLQTAQAETSRLESASAQLRRKAATFLHEVGGAKVLQNARSTHEPDPAHWWWFLDQMLIDRRRAQLRRWLVWGTAAVLLFALLSFIYDEFLAPDPAILANIQHQETAERLAQEGNWTDALSEVEQVLAVVPDDPKGLTLKGILLQELGQSEAAERTFATAESSFDSREKFLIARAGQLLLLNHNEAALVDVQELLAIQEDSAMGYMLLGQANTNLENYEAAVAAFQQASTLAESQGIPELAVSARMQMGMAMQMIAAPTATNP